MPELPEVETLRLGLKKYLVGHKIEDVEVRLRRIVSGDVKNIIVAKFTKVERFGKGLVMHLDNGYAIAVHIKLTGQLIYQEVSKASKVKVIKGTYSTLPNKWTHVIFKLKSQIANRKTEDAYLYYNDFRQFGWIKIVKKDEVAKLPFFKELGPEFSIDVILGIRPEPETPGSGGDSGQARMTKEILTLKKFAEIIKKAKTAIKPLIMDQKKISGIGNIYANDSLNLARIDPSRKSNTLSDKEIETFYKALETVLKRGLKYGGASELSYVNVLGQEGGYQKHFLAYGREGEKCFNCGGTIEKIKLGGRGTYFCRRCQT